ncbi:MAG TPA: hypothetical protein VFF52_25565 [Isosphaeraceae bacterium]|nr:hypothetical protein [Isosphaeraceae bacterium]
MPKKSASARLVRSAAGELPARTTQDRDRLEAAMRIPVKPSEEREYHQLGPAVRRDASGQIVRPPLGPVRRAILAALDRHQMTRYELWKKAHARCATLSASAVYEYLRGTRNIGSEYVETLIEAARLKIVERGTPRARKPTTGRLKRSPTL